MNEVILLGVFNVAVVAVDMGFIVLIIELFEEF